MKNSYKIISVDNRQRRLGVMTLLKKDNKLLVKVDMDPIHPGLFNQNFVFELLRKVEIATASTEEEKTLVLESIDHLQDHCRKLLIETRPPFRILRFTDCDAFMPMLSVIGPEDNHILTYSSETLQDLITLHGRVEALDLFRKEHMETASEDKKVLVNEAIDFVQTNILMPKEYFIKLAKTMYADPSNNQDRYEIIVFIEHLFGMSKKDYAWAEVMRGIHVEFGTFMR